MVSSNSARVAVDLPDQPAPEQQLAALTALCKASGDSLRLLVLRALRKDSFGVSELCSIFDIRQPAPVQLGLNMISFLSAVKTWNALSF